MSKIEPFEVYYQEYENWFEVNEFAYESELRAVVQYIPSSKVGMEIGVGSGRFAAPLGVRYGLDPSFEMIKIAKRRGIIVVKGTAEFLPVRDKIFDYILMVTAICFFDDIEGAFKEAFRVLKPGGNLIVGFVDKNSRIGKKYQRLKNKSHFYKIATFYSPQEVVSCLEKCGFQVLTFSQTIFRDIEEIRKVKPVESGYGRGSFVVINATKRGDVE